MKLTKSWKSACLMAYCFVIPAVVIAFATGEIRYFLTPPAQRNPVTANGFAGPGPALIALAVLLVSIGLAALVIDRLNETHYGRQGAIRWIVAGILYGLLQQIVLSPIPVDFDYRLVSVLKQIGGDLLWKLLTLVLVYLFVFPLLSRFVEWRRGRQRQ
jgi:O-antigen/teichoic acid export membrane protein